MNLDRTKDFAVVHGDSEGRCFEQDNRFFTAEGKLWRDPKKKESAEERAEREKAEKAEADRIAAEAEATKKAAAGGETDPQLQKQLGGS